MELFVFFIPPAYIFPSTEFEVYILFQFFQYLS